MTDIGNLKVGFIGAGNMAEAIVRGMIAGKLVSPDRITVADPSAERRILFRNTFNILPVTDNRLVVDGSDVILLAVKPQYMKAAVEPLSSSFKGDQIVISIAAGIRTETLDALCGGKPSIVRVMPNTPALVGKGVSALCSGPRADDRALAVTEELFASVGETVRVDESAMDAVTAISGSGPAYVFYWMEAMLKAAAAQGFDAATARKLVYKTIEGSAALALSSADTPDVLRARVTSKGGTTEAAIRTLDELGTSDALVKAVDAAARRSRELSQSA